MGTSALPGLDRLLEVCGRLGLQQSVLPPGKHPPEPFAPVAGTPLDPALASFYSRMGKAILAADADGLVIFQVDDGINQLEAENNSLRAGWQGDYFAPLFVFGGRPLLAHYFATVPSWSDPSGFQPVVRVDTYERPYALPIASTVDRLFDTYSHYLEELVAHEDFNADGAAALSFPWKVPHLLARDERLVQLIREGSFDALMTDADARAWSGEVLNAHSRL
jgi:hypothetical protein